MLIDRKALLPREVRELVQRRLAELTEELRAIDPGFREGVYVLPAVDGCGHRDGLWLMFGPNTEIKSAIDSLEEGNKSIINFLEDGLLEEIKLIGTMIPNSHHTALTKLRCVPSSP